MFFLYPHQPSTEESFVAAREELGQLSLIQGHQHGFMQQPRPWTSAWVLMVTWASDINTSPGLLRTTNPLMAHSGCTDPNMASIHISKLSSSPRQQRPRISPRGLSQQHRLQTSSPLLKPGAVEWTREISMASSGVTNQSLQGGPL